MKVFIFLCFFGFSLLMSEASEIGDFVGVWRTRDDVPNDAQLVLHVCVQEEEEEDHEGGHKKRSNDEELGKWKLYARVFDEEKEEYSMLAGILFEIVQELEGGREEDTYEFRGNFVSGGYPLFSGPGYPENAHCYLHEFRWSEKEIVFRCNVNDYHKVRLQRLSDEEPSAKECFIPDTEDTLVGEYESDELEVNICVDGTLNKKVPFRIRMSGELLHEEEEKKKKREEEELNTGFLEGATFLDGRVASGQYYESNSSHSEPGKKLLLIRRRNDQIFIVYGLSVINFYKVNEHSSEYRDAFLFGRHGFGLGRGGERRRRRRRERREEEGLECDSFVSYGPTISGTYESPISHLPEIFVCENDGFLTAMYGYVGVFLGELNEDTGRYDTIWAESGYDVQDLIGTADLYFTEVGLGGEAIAGEEMFSLSHHRLSRGIPPTHLCMAGAFNNFTMNSTLEGTWGIDPQTTLAICFDDDADDIYHKSGHEEEEDEHEDEKHTFYHLSYGFADEDNSGGFESGIVHNSLRLSSGVFEEPNGHKGFSLSVQSGDDVMYNIYVYDNDLNGFTDGFDDDPIFGAYTYERVSEEGSKCDFYRELFSESGAETIKICGILFYFFAIYSLFF